MVWKVLRLRNHDGVIAEHHKSKKNGYNQNEPAVTVVDCSDEPPRSFGARAACILTLSQHVCTQQDLYTGLQVKITYSLGLID